MPFTGVAAREIRHKIASPRRIFTLALPRSPNRRPSQQAHVYVHVRQSGLRHPRWPPVRPPWERPRSSARSG